MSNLLKVNLANNCIKDKSVDILMALCEENTHISSINLQGNQFKSRLVLNKLKAIKDKKILL